MVLVAPKKEFLITGYSGQTFLVQSQAVKRVKVIMGYDFVVDCHGL